MKIKKAKIQRHSTMYLNSKQHLLEKLEELSLINKDTKILELGSGRSKAIAPLLEKFPNLHYVGVEPDPVAADIAQSRLRDYENATIYNELAYDPIGEHGEFDLCISLSVLEHVKQLEKFLEGSVKQVKEGGLIIHRYDLGHSLYPSSAKEKFQVYLGNNFPSVLPEHKFVRYLDPQTVRSILEDHGAQIEKTIYHQMPNHKQFLKLFDADSEEKVVAAKKMIDWEYEISEYLDGIDQRERELLFPSITIWARKK